MGTRVAAAAADSSKARRESMSLTFRRMQWHGAGTARFEIMRREDRREARATRRRFHRFQQQANRDPTASAETTGSAIIAPGPRLLATIHAHGRRGLRRHVHAGVRVADHRSRARPTHRSYAVLSNDAPPATSSWVGEDKADQKSDGHHEPEANIVGSDADGIRAFSAITVGTIPAMRRIHRQQLRHEGAGQCAQI